MTSPTQRERTPARRFGARLFVLVVPVLVGAAGCNECDVVDGPVTDAAIDEGIAGFGTFTEDDCGFVCACRRGDIDFGVAAVDALPLDDAEANEVVGAASFTAIDMRDGRYALEVGPGLYLACDAFACAGLQVTSGAVSTLHASSSVGGVYFRVFDDDDDAGNVDDDTRRYRVDADL